MSESLSLCGKSEGVRGEGEVEGSGVKVHAYTYMCCRRTYQARSKPILIGQAILYCNTVRVRYAHMSSRGVWGHAPPENLKKTTHH